jgi:NIMA (never in mitosis gene a)-related kinase 1/4/5
LKGANIFLLKDGNIKLGDFGISKAMDKTVLASKSFVGTPFYLSPEMVEGKPYSTKADIWALGIILYHMCALKLPFDANSLPVLALKIMKGSFPQISGNQYSRDLKSLIASMLLVDQRKRPNIN